jgi:serine/threonine protein kinase
MMASRPTRYGRYEIVGPLATGGMADLLLARARGPDGFESLAAIKRIRSHLALDPQFVRLFLGEAKLAAQLRHPNVVHVYDAGEERGEYYFVMEYVHGRDLRALLRTAQARGRVIDVGEAISIVAPLCAGLHHAHERLGSDGQPLGIVHRDVSPANVLLSWDGAVKLADFGIAKATRAAGEAGTNNLRGKVHYMSPEQCLAQPVDRRSDLYSLSVVLYELLTGQRPHPEAESEFLTLRRTVEEPATPPSRFRAGLPRELERIVLAGLERDRDRRPASTRELQLSLEELARTERLAISPLTVAKLVEELFGDELHAWEAAQSSGKALSQHLAETGTVSVDRIDEAATVASRGEPSGPSEEQPLRRRWRRSLVAALIGSAAALSIALAIGFGSSSAKREADTAAKTARAAPIATPPPPPRPIEPPASAALPPPAPPPAPEAARPKPPHVSTARVRLRKDRTKEQRSARWDPEAPVLPH